MFSVRGSPSSKLMSIEVLHSTAGGDGTQEEEVELDVYKTNSVQSHSAASFFPHIHEQVRRFQQQSRWSSVVPNRYLEQLSRPKQRFLVEDE